MKKKGNDLERICYLLKLNMRLSEKAHKQDMKLERHLNNTTKEVSR